MICPACNSEFASQSEYCENCGAPAYLARAAQTMETIYCTYCGAREESGHEACVHCGLKKNYRVNEMGIGNCGNCGTLWRNIWLYCQTCGIARENALIQAPAPIPVVSQIHYPTHPNTSPAPSYTTPMYIPTLGKNIDDEVMQVEEAEAVFSEFDFPSPTLSEKEVVERMFAAPTNGSKAPAEREASHLSVVTENENVGAVSPAGIIYDLQAHKDESLKVAQALAQSQSASESLALPADEIKGAVPELQSTNQAVITPFPRVNNIEEFPLLTPPPVTVTPTPILSNEQVTPTPDAVAAAQTRPSLVTPATPTQSVKAINRPRGVAPAADKKLIRLIIILTTLILLFAALIVSGFRIRDLFNGQFLTRSNGKDAATKIVPVEMPTNPPPAPEGMVYLPGGTFTMGVNNDGSNYESPAHLVTVQPFFLDKTEVTNAQYAQFVKATNRAVPTHWAKGVIAKGEENFPVTNVSWNDARAYATWTGKRLPKETEWEFAARSNTQRKYAWGNDWDAARANTQESNLNRAVAVGSFPNGASPFGILDLTGNVAEWIDGEVVSYKDKNILLNPGKLTRGGSFANAHDLATTTHRGYTIMDTQSPAIGFRCARDVK